LNSITGTRQKSPILYFARFGLFFSYDMLGYAFMSLSTFFAGLAIDVQTRPNKWLKALLFIHGVFFIACLPVLFPLACCPPCIFQNSMGNRRLFSITPN